MSHGWRSIEKNEAARLDRPRLLRNSRRPVAMTSGMFEPD